MNNIFTKYIIPRLGIDILGFYAMLILLSILAGQLTFNSNVILGMISMYLLLLSAFVVNDIADRQDDADCIYAPQSWQDNLRMILGLPLVGTKPNGGKRFINIFSHQVPGWVGWVIVVLAGVVALVISYSIAFNVFVISSIMFIVGICYSSYPFRLKSKPILDIISHSLLLAGLPIMYFLAYPEAVINYASVLIVGLSMFISIVGDLQNEYRDYEEDQAAGITNTAHMIGNKTLLGNITGILYSVSVVSMILAVVWQVVW